MARRTRKEKVIANLRRELRASKVTDVKKVGKKVQTLNSDEPAKLVSFVKSDLKKTLALSTLAISLELVLYLTLS
jgi:hypothetical protein